MMICLNDLYLYIRMNHILVEIEFDFVKNW